MVCSTGEIIATSANQILPLKFHRDTKMLYYIHQTHLFSCSAEGGGELGTRLMNCYANRSIRPAYSSYVKSHFKMHLKHGFFWHSLATVWCDEVNLELGTLQVRLIELYVHTYFVNKPIVTEDMTSNFMALFVGIGGS